MIVAYRDKNNWNKTEAGESIFISLKKNMTCEEVHKSEIFRFVMREE